MGINGRHIGLVAPAVDIVVMAVLAEEIGGIGLSFRIIDFQRFLPAWRKIPLLHIGIVCLGVGLNEADVSRLQIAADCKVVRVILSCRDSR